VVNTICTQDRRFIKQHIDPQQLKDRMSTHKSLFFPTDKAGELAQNFEALLTRIWSETYFPVPKSFVRELFDSNHICYSPLWR
jgi:hypothetical protein